jgi:hypothetical protein
MDLDQLGVTSKYNHFTSTVEVNGVEVKRTETTRFTMTLPQAAKLTVSFTKEGLVQKFVKLFKNELQVGDAEFDKAVYISTDSQDATKRFLESPQMRALILELVRSGSVEINGTTVKAEAPGHLSEAPAELAALVSAVLR